MPFISIEKSKRKSIIEDLVDGENYLGLKNDRGRLINLGIALGIDRPYAIESKDNLYRDEYVKNNFEMQAIIVCAAIANFPRDCDVNTMLKEENIFNNANNCLNRGLDIIGDQITSMPEDNAMLRYLQDMDALYDANVGKK